MVRSIHILGLAALLLVLLAGCTSESDEVGVVARVNGHPIYLTDLEAKYDLSHIDSAPVAPPSPESLKREYMSILKDLIAPAACPAGAAEKGIPVSEEELNAAEARVRMDYPKGGFEQVLIEEYIDLETWRQQLLSYLSYEKFLKKILKPKIQLTEADIKAYYQKHVSSFGLPERIAFVLVKGPELDNVKHVLKLVAKGVDQGQLHKQFPSVEVQNQEIPVKQLPESMSRLLQKLKPGQCSSVNAADVGFEGVMLQKRLPESQQQLSAVKKEVARLAMEEKLQQAYVSWLENELASSKISISEYLLDSEKVVSRAQERHRKNDGQLVNKSVK